MTAVKVPPGPTGPLAFRYMWTLRGNPAATMQNLARQYGDAVSFKFGRQRVFVFSHPDQVQELLVGNQRHLTKGRVLEQAKALLGDGLLTSHGDYHLRQRRMLQPAFHRQRIATFADTMATYTARASDRWTDGETRDIAADMMALTLAIVGKTLFDADVEADAADVGEAMHELVAWSTSPLLPWMPLLEKFRAPVARRLRQASERLDGIIWRMIAEHRQTGDRGDLLTMLLNARFEDDGSQLSDQQIRDEAITLFLAGHETTANALAWTWYLLAQHPGVEAKLHAEIEAVLRGGLPTAASASALEYTRRVVTEAMRLYPPAWVLARRAAQAIEIGGYPIPAGSIVFVSQYVIHRDARWFPEPERFDPDRWQDSGDAARPKYAYFPFGAGSRICIGEAFAWLELVIAVAVIAQRWRLRLAPGHRVELQPRITLRPAHGMRMTLSRRPTRESTWPIASD